jgi:hypothetical protein
MIRSGLFIATAFTLLLTGVILVRAAHTRRSDADSVRTRHTLTGDMAIRFRQAQPTHWRALLLQH